MCVCVCVHVPACVCVCVRACVCVSKTVCDIHHQSDSRANTQNPNRAKTLEIDLSKVVVGPQLGMGGSGCAVYIANVDGWDCAMKELKLANAKQSDVDAFMAEMLLLESLPSHKNLV